MALHPQAGKPAAPEQLINVAQLVSQYYSYKPDAAAPTEAVSFGTSGHRGSASNYTFTDTHISAICQALVEYREAEGITGPLFIGKDTHALSEPAMITAIEVLSANGVDVVIQRSDNESLGYTPTPVISRTIIRYNRENAAKSDGVVITPSHNPPEDGGFKYNPPHGGPADSDVTTKIQNRANALIAEGNKDVKRIDIRSVRAQKLVREEDFMEPYIDDLAQVIDMQAIAKAGLKLGTDPLGGAGIGYWSRIADKYGLDITVVNPAVDPQFGFMRRDKDGKLRMDCSSAFAMAGLIELKDDFDLAWGNDPDFDRHGIVCKSAGLMNPNHYLAVAIQYLYTHRPEWPASLKIGKTLVSSSMIDRVANSLDKPLAEMPVGFKWFVDGLSNSEIGFAGEESAGGIFLQRNGETWATDKDGFILCLLAAEILAVTKKDPGEHYQALTEQFSSPVYNRVDVAATLEQKQKLSAMDASVVTSDTLAGEPITAVQTHAPGNNAAIGGVKVSTENGWFAARPSGTEQIYKIYAESFKGETHLQELIQEAEALVGKIIK
ncbi:phosphoglucomutase, alpha-D-glucose phosphate-specific [Alteromonas sp. KS69]|jgi:phosphoglucomutase|uniref:phosphoglucomutase (alpha-D-glucose-1,6-bisphosphate-dependent) n=1 Tax=unclassified Alteromonas TaxID=2614992 RepID=UPI000C0EE736|nr:MULTISPECIES: phosphoglucomutase (alpha-D-glucose-1,6-bisphosphate-dependent) [unclassified Alteromonas]MBB68373.1 phosphoglucomutase, alpha-D-glucose phosphate-specific [Rickettsiales bacterium]MBO7924389.1 phosphoglucomutase (alpha-D-glucose-1,6-bisphosphate-dependent) [Alteromonas sp. K632G]PHS55331.1 MAG: phosphoglucomutase, alpha-D-glucose phosphate-specific [Alteromonas sp.]RUP75334.1 phosphoglucomutase, alpha-D-glucose phosphate-specific [Alteromonas sp. KS69]|tara:strand:+ start:3359 stop:5008 length:1650 start_codon:yes stop_codon:yes gene_type:complete